MVSRIVNQQTLDFNQFCEFLADGSTVTSTDVAAVMKRIETRMPFLLGMNAKVVCSPEGLTFKPVISGSITQSQLKQKLEKRLVEDPLADIDVNRSLKTSDLTINDLTTSIDIEMPKKWNERFVSNVEFKRVASTSDSATNETDNPDNVDSGSGTPNTGSGGSTPGGSDEMEM